MPKQILCELAASKCQLIGAVSLPILFAAKRAIGLLR